jgi:hypothetical protein
MNKMVQELIILSSLQAGLYECNSRPWWRKILKPREREGWIDVSHDKDQNISIMWTSDEDFHWPHGIFGPALSITFSPDGKLINYMESVRTMWIKWGYGRGTEKEYNRGIEFAKWIHYLMTNNLLKKQR